MKKSMSAIIVSLCIVFGFIGYIFLEYAPRNQVPATIQESTPPQLPKVETPSARVEPPQPPAINAELNEVVLVGDREFAVDAPCGDRIHASDDGYGRFIARLKSTRGKIVKTGRGLDFAKFTDELAGGSVLTVVENGSIVKNPTLEGTVVKNGYWRVTPRIEAAYDVLRSDIATDSLVQANLFGYDVGSPIPLERLKEIGPSWRMEQMCAVAEKQTIFALFLDDIKEDMTEANKIEALAGMLQTIVSKIYPAISEKIGNAAELEKALAGIANAYPKIVAWANSLPDYLQKPLMERWGSTAAKLAVMAIDRAALHTYFLDWEWDRDIATADPEWWGEKFSSADDAAVFHGRTQSEYRLQRRYARRGRFVFEEFQQLVKAELGEAQ